MATKPSQLELSLPDVGETPNQPRHHDFSERSFGKTKVVTRTFQPSWFNKWKWLHYSTPGDLAFCHTCVTAIKTGRMKVTGNVQDSSFLTGGFSNWKDASKCYSNHEQTTMHKTAVEYMVTLPNTTSDVGGMLSSSHAVEKQKNRQYILKVAQNIRFLARQGIPLRGDGNEADSNFMQLLHLRADDDPNIIPFTAKDKQVYQPADTK